VEVFVLLVIKFLDALVMVIIVDALLSWFQGPEAFPRRYTGMLTSQLYRPIHMVVRPVIGGMDLTPIVVIVILNLLGQGLVKALGA
jgi:uncharacterized protein YggT (Ycf19 family)